MPPPMHIEIPQDLVRSIRDPSLRHKLLRELARGESGITLVGTASSAATAAGGGGGGGGGGTTGSGPDAATRLAIALGDLDTYEDGEVITADSYNAIVEVLRALVGFAAGGAVTGALETAGVETFAPTLLTLGEVRVHGAAGDPWQLAPDFAEVNDDGFGWMPVTLPDGVLIDELSVVNARAEGATIEATLRRLSLVDPEDGGVELCRIREAKGGGITDVQTDSAPVRVRGISTGPALDELRRVDHAEFRYVIEARAVSSQVKIYALQVSWER